MSAHSHEQNGTEAGSGRATPRSAAAPLMVVLCAAVLGAGAASRPLAWLYNRIAYAWQPRVHVPEPHQDWGVAPAGQLVEHRFRIENRGGRPLFLVRDIPVA